MQVFLLAKPQVSGVAEQKAVIQRSLKRFPQHMLQKVTKLKANIIAEQLFVNVDS